MTWIVDWNGKEYDIDPGEFTGIELGLIHKRTTLTYRQLMTEALPNFDGDAVRALFWIVDRRTNSGLKFDDYEGPPMKVFIGALAGFPPLVEELGKVVDAAFGTTGSESSASSTDGAPPIDLNA